MAEAENGSQDSTAHERNLTPEYICPWHAHYAVQGPY